MITWLQDRLRNLKYGVQNIIAYWPIIWSDRDWDWEYFARLNEFKLRRMHSLFVKYGCHVNSKRDARQMLICAELLKRLQEDDGLSIPYGQHLIRMKEWQQMYGRYIGKYLQNWWT